MDDDEITLSGSDCPFTGIAQITPVEGGYVVIRNCYVTSTDNIDGLREFTVEANRANNMVETGQRFETGGDPNELGPQDYRASLSCPLKDAFTVTFAAAE